MGSVGCYQCPWSNFIPSHPMAYNYRKTNHHPCRSSIKIIFCYRMEYTLLKHIILILKFDILCSLASKPEYLIYEVNATFFTDQSLTGRKQAKLQRSEWEKFLLKMVL